MAKPVRAKKQRIPHLQATANQQDPLVWLRFFTPWARWEWYVIEFDGNDTCFGYVRGVGAECCCFRLSQLREGRTYGGPWIEQDTLFRPTRLSEVVRHAQVT